jgi:hypothetical protein
VRLLRPCNQQWLVTGDTGIPTMPTEDVPTTTPTHVITSPTTTEVVGTEAAGDGAETEVAGEDIEAAEAMAMVAVEDMAAADMVVGTARSLSDSG